MRFFNRAKENSKADNSEESDPSAGMEREKLWQRSWKRYLAHLDRIADRLGPSAYRFFRFGNNESGLHDGYLLRFSLGDAIDSSEAKLRKLRFGAGPGRVEMIVLNYEKTLLHRFVFKGPRKVIADIPSADPLFCKEGRTLGQVYLYEASAVSSKYLAVEWLLDSGGTILIEFEKLIHTSKRIPISRPQKRKRSKI